VDLISIGECAKLLTRYNDTDNAADIQLVRYYQTDNELVILIRYKSVDLKCVIDKLSFVDREVPEAETIQDFINYYLKPPMPVLPILGVEEEDDKKVRIEVSQVS
jgi:hypothetical protein